MSSTGRKLPTLFMMDSSSLHLTINVLTANTSSKPSHQEIGSKQNTTSSLTDDSLEGLSSGEIAAVAVGVCTACLLAVALVLIWCCRYRRRSEDSECIIAYDKYSTKDLSLSNVSEEGHHTEAYGQECDTAVVTSSDLSSYSSPSLHSYIPKMNPEIEKEEAKDNMSSFLHSPSIKIIISDFSINCGNDMDSKGKESTDISYRQLTNFTDDLEEGFHNPCFGMEEVAFPSSTLNGALDETVNSKAADTQRHSFPASINLNQMNTGRVRRSYRLDGRVASAIAAQRNRETSVFKCIDDITSNKNKDIVIVFGQRTVL